MTGILSAYSQVQSAFIASVAPSGDTTGVTDTTTLNNVLGIPNSSVQLAIGKYYLNAPLVIAPYTALVGQFNTTQVSQTEGGSVLFPVAGFTGKVINDGGNVTLTSVILLLGQTFGGYTTVSEEQKIRNIQIDASSAPASVNGITSYGRVTRVQLSEVLVSKVTGDGVQHNLDVAGNQPDAWNGYKVFCRFGSGKGYNLRSADSTWVNCLSSNNSDAGVDWFINNTSNSKYIGCRSEHALGVGYGYVCTNSGNSSGDVSFIGCTTDQSGLHGMQLGGTINSVVSFLHGTPVALNGCVFRRDGSISTNSGYAGLLVNGYGSSSGGLVTVNGCQVWPGVNDDGTGNNTPQYGFSFVQSSTVAVGGGTSIIAATTAIQDDGTNTINYDNSVTTGAGSTATVVPNMNPYIANYQGATLTLHPAAAPASDPLFIQNQNAAERSVGIRVSGQGNDRWKVTSSGVLSWGPGTATQDIAISRPSTGILSVTDNSANNSAMMRVAASTAQTSATELFSAVCNASGDVSYIAKVTGDTNNRYRIDSNGQIQWGSGAASLDVQQGRISAGFLGIQPAAGTTSTGGVQVTAAGSAASVFLLSNTQTTPAQPTFQISSKTSGDSALGVFVTGDTNERFTSDSTGKLLWGTGAATQDIQLTRNSPGLLIVSDGGNNNNAGLRVSASTAQTSSTALLQSYCNASGDVAYIAQLATGDTFSRYRLDSNGLIKWGPGNATQDCQLSRIAGGTLGTVTTDFAVHTAGRGLQVAEGANAKQGTFTFTANGRATVATTAVTANSRIFLTNQGSAGTLGIPWIATKNAGASFIVQSTSATDTSTYAYEIFEPG